MDDNVPEQTDNVPRTGNVPETKERIRKIQPIALHVDKKTWNLFRKISDRTGVTMASMGSEAVLEWIEKNRDLVSPTEKRDAKALRTEKMQKLRDIQRMKRLTAASSPCKWARIYPGKPWPGYPAG
jgi:hypothetical protein